MNIVQVARLLISLGGRAHRRIRIQGCESWPLADGTIFQSEVIHREEGCYAQLIYSYSAEGEYFSGTYEKPFLRTKRAHAFAERFPSGTRIPIHYKPAKPELSAVVFADLGLFLHGF